MNVLQSLAYNETFSSQNVVFIMYLYITKEMGICYAVEHFVKTDSQPMLYRITSNLEQFYGGFVLILYQNRRLLNHRDHETFVLSGTLCRKIPSYL